MSVTLGRDDMSRWEAFKIGCTAQRGEERVMGDKKGDGCIEIDKTYAIRDANGKITKTYRVCQVHSERGIYRPDLVNEDKPMLAQDLPFAFKAGLFFGAIVDFFKRRSVDFVSVDLTELQAKTVTASSTALGQSASSPSVSGSTLGQSASSPSVSSPSVSSSTLRQSASSPSASSQQGGAPPLPTKPIPTQPPVGFETYNKPLPPPPGLAPKPSGASEEFGPYQGVGVYPGLDEEFASFRREPSSPATSPSPPSPSPIQRSPSAPSIMAPLADKKAMLAETKGKIAEMSSEASESTAMAPFGQDLERIPEEWHEPIKQALNQIVEYQSELDQEGLTVVKDKPLEITYVMSGTKLTVTIAGVVQEPNELDPDTLKTRPGKTREFRHQFDVPKPVVAESAGSAGSRPSSPPSIMMSSQPAPASSESPVIKDVKQTITDAVVQQLIQPPAQRRQRAVSPFKTTESAGPAPGELTIESPPRTPKKSSSPVSRPVSAQPKAEVTSKSTQSVGGEAALSKPQEASVTSSSTPVVEDLFDEPTAPKPPADIVSSSQDMWEASRPEPTALTQEAIRELRRNPIPQDVRAEESQGPVGKTIDTVRAQLKDNITFQSGLMMEVNTDRNMPKNREEAVELVKDAMIGAHEAGRFDENPLDPWAESTELNDAADLVVDLLSPEFDAPTRNFLGTLTNEPVSSVGRQVKVNARPGAVDIFVVGKFSSGDREYLWNRQAMIDLSTKEVFFSTPSFKPLPKEGEERSSAAEPIISLNGQKIEGDAVSVIANDYASKHVDEVTPGDPLPGATQIAETENIQARTAEFYNTMMGSIPADNKALAAHVSLRWKTADPFVQYEVNPDTMKTSIDTSKRGRVTATIEGDLVRTATAPGGVATTSSAVTSPDNLKFRRKIILDLDTNETTQKPVWVEVVKLTSVPRVGAVEEGLKTVVAEWNEKEKTAIENIAEVVPAIMPWTNVPLKYNQGETFYMTRPDSLDETQQMIRQTYRNNRTYGETFSDWSSDTWGSKEKAAAAFLTTQANPSVATSNVEQFIADLNDETGENFTWDGQFLISQMDVESKGDAITMWDEKYFRITSGDLGIMVKYVGCAKAKVPTGSGKVYPVKFTMPMVDSQPKKPTEE